MRFFVTVGTFALLFLNSLFSKSVHYAELEYADVVERSHEMLEQHASFHEMNDVIAKRVLERFLSTIDPMKVYFLASEVDEWLNPSPEMLQNVKIGFSTGTFEQFQRILSVLSSSIQRSESLEKIANTFPKPAHTPEKYLKNISWAADIDQLLIRLRMIQSLEEAVWSRFTPDVQKKAQERFEKRKRAAQELLFSSNPIEKEKILSTLILKSFAQALDSQSAYFTPVEANQFVISVQQKLCGIGVMFRDDIDGFTVLELVPGGPAERQGQLKVNDKVIAVDNEPVVGADLYEVVEMIRGKKQTPVTLQVIREVGSTESPQKESLYISIQRDDVIVRDVRLASKILPSTVGPLGYLHLSSFYQDEENSSAEDMRRALKDLMNKEAVSGVVLDLRGNPGGILQQAVDVCGLFMDSAFICAVKEGDALYPFWNMKSKKIWNGPLVVLIDRTSASASEIVAQALQDWGRALVIGDDRTFGKGSFQMLSFPADNASTIDPRGEYKISRGRYYTASGKSPQLTGVHSDIEVCSPYRFLDIGETYSSYPLSNESIPSYFESEYASPDDQEKPFSLREKIIKFFSRAVTTSPQFQKKQDLSLFLIPVLKDHSIKRLQQEDKYQQYLKNLQKKALAAPDEELAENNEEEKKESEDFVCQEAVHIVEDLIHMSSHEKRLIITQKAA